MEDRKRKSLKAVAAVTLFLILASLLGTFCLLRPPRGNVIEILRDDEVLYTLDLSTAEDQEIVIPYGDSSNTVLVRDGTVCVVRAQCPDNICVRTGILRWEGMPIVCLPNHLVIRYASK